MPQIQSTTRAGRYRRPVLLLLGVLLLALGLVACGGDDEDSGDSGTTSSTGTTAAAPAGSSIAGASGTSASGASSNVGTDQGNSIAHAAMISEQDLPGTGWTVVTTDEFGGSLLDADQSELATTKACESYVQRVTKAAEKANQSRIGRASKSFQKTGALLGATVDVEVTVYKESKTAGELISEAKGAFSSNDFESCFREIVKGSEGEIPAELQLDIKSAKAAAQAPHSGIAQAYDLEFASAGIKLSLHTEVYAWADGNATAFVTIFGTPDTISADVVKAAVSKTDDKLSKAK